MIVSASIWWNKFDDDEKKILLDSITANELKENSIRNLIHSKKGKLPDRLYQYHLGLVDKLMNNEPTFEVIRDNRINSLPRYDMINRELLYSYSSIIRLLTVCFPSRRDSKNLLRMRL